jgi:hypothetical protein
MDSFDVYSYLMRRKHYGETPSQALRAVRDDRGFPHFPKPSADDVARDRVLKRSRDAIGAKWAWQIAYSVARLENKGA